jgi:predicted DNA binding CopG/RHH family protein
MKKSKKALSKTSSANDDPLAGDLSDLMLNADWQSAKFELTKPKKKTITLRISEELLNELKKRADKLGLDYQRLIRITLENSLRRKVS